MITPSNLPIPTMILKSSRILRPFGENQKVSLFTLGTMRAIGSVQQMYEVLKAAHFSGINHIETAPAYGPAENFLGKALQELQKSDYVLKKNWLITSKLLPGISFEEGKRQLRGILSRLNLNSIDNLAVHGVNLPEHLDWVLTGEGADLFSWAQEENLISQIGFSSHGAPELIQQAIESNRFQFCSLHLHLLDPKRIPLAKIALKKGMGVMAISPADKGGQLQRPSSTLIKDCAPIAPLELAYRFLITQGISTLTLGASKVKDLKMAKKLASADGPLDQVEINSIERLHQESHRRLGTTLCGQCYECLPCPNNVPIPNLLNLRNVLIGHDLESFAKERYNLINRAGHWWAKVDASKCEKCGECIPRCPNNLDIPKLLEETHKKLKEAPRKRLWG